MDINKILNALSLEEKVGLLSGQDVWNTLAIKRLNIPSLRMADGPFGIRRQVDDFDSSGKKGSMPATCFPAPALLACSFNKELLYEIGVTMAKEAIKYQVNVLLAPGVNIKRNPLAGRNFEYFSEDPYLTGELASALVKGLASLNVGAAVKHFVLNEQESYRYSTASIVDEVALNDIYLKPFEKVIKTAQPSMIMSSYNKSVNGFVGEDANLITNYLRNKFGFNGIIVSDWGAVSNRVEALKAGLDLEMPSSAGYNDALIIKAIKANEIKEDLINQSVSRILNQVNKLKIKDVPIKDELHHQLAYKAALESFVLLKNENSILPFKINDDFAVIGELAEHNRIQGGGSSRVNPTYVSNIFNRFKKEGVQIKYAKGYRIEDQQIDEQLVDEAVALAKSVSKVLLFVGLTDYDENEGIDRKHLKLNENQMNLISKVSSVNQNIVMILTGGSVVELPFLNDIKGLIMVSLMGQGGARAVMDLILGLVSPSGKLAETYPIKLADVPSSNYFPGGNNSTYYVESKFIGYPYFNSEKINLNFPFGFGLSYNQYQISNLEFNQDLLELKFEIINNGNFDGAEIIQIYQIESDRLVKLQKLVAFEKIFLQPHQTKQIKIKIDKEELKSYYISTKQKEIIGNHHLIQVGTSSRDILKTFDLKLSGVNENKQIVLDSHNLNLEAFKANLGVSNLPPTNVNYQPGSFNLDTPLYFLRKTIVGKVIYKAAVKSITDNAGKNIFNDKAMIEGLDFTPMRTLAIMSAGSLSLKTASFLIEIMNKKIGVAIKILLTKQLKDPNNKDQ